MMTPRDAIVRLRLADLHTDVPCAATAAMQGDTRGVTVLPLGPDTSGQTMTLYGRAARRLSLETRR